MKRERARKRARKRTREKESVFRESTGRYEKKRSDVSEVRVEAAGVARLKTVIHQQQNPHHYQFLLPTSESDPSSFDRGPRRQGPLKLGVPYC